MLQDTFGREITYLRLSVTERCNLRCRYCMPEEGIEELCMTTNATMLNGGTAEELKKAGVNRLNISLDTLDPQKYAWITRRGSLKDAMEGIEAALDAGFQKIKLNMVLIGGFNEEEIPSLAELSRQWPVDVRFIEMMPMLGNREFGEGAYIPHSRVIDALPDLQPVEGSGTSEMKAGTAETHGVAKLYRLPGAKGRVGLISPMSDHFCASCNRLRLTADGKIKPCLHSAAEFSIKGLDREGMICQFQAAVLAKPQWHGELNFMERSRSIRRMNQIGG